MIMTQSQQRLRMMFLFVVLLVASTTTPVFSFRSSTVKLAPRQRTSFLANNYRPTTTTSKLNSQKVSSSTKSKSSSSTGLNMFMGSDGGILGVGAPEVATILLVGYFVLGPSDLYKVVREVGSFVQNIRTLGNDLTKSFETNLESNFQLEEIRKAQQELNDAFSFRRTINTNQEEEAFTTNVKTERPGEESMGNSAASPGITAAAVATEEEGATAGGAATAAAPKKKIRRRVRKQVPAAATPTENPSDLEMPATAVEKAAAATKKGFVDPFVQEEEESSSSSNNLPFTPEEEAAINADFDKYTLDTTTDMSTGPTWYDGVDLATAPADNDSTPAAATPIQQPTAAEKSRFQQQLSGTWNEQILDKTEDLKPLAKVMDLLALLEEEKIASQQRLEDEFRLRAKTEEEFYRKQRKLLEEASAEVQSKVYSTTTSKPKQ